MVGSQTLEVQPFSAFSQITPSSILAQLRIQFVFQSIQRVYYPILAAFGIPCKSVSPAMYSIR